MEITIQELLTGAKEARGLAVIIDVFRAFSLECALFDQGAARILAVGAKEKAYAIKEENPDVVLVGERNEKKLPGFDFGNSPSQIAGVSLRGKTIVHTTSAGTQGLAAATNADTILTGSLVNARAIADCIRQKAPDQVTLVAAGVNGVNRSDEDLLCARYIKALLTGQEDLIRMDEEIEALKKGTGARFFDPSHGADSPEADFFFCTRCNQFPFAIQAVGKDDIFEMQKIPV